MSDIIVLLSSAKDAPSAVTPAMLLIPRDWVRPRVPRQRNFAWQYYGDWKEGKGTKGGV